MRSLGIDYGAKRLGIAVSDATGIVVGKTWLLLNNKQLLDELDKIISLYPDLGTIVVGLPKNLRGKDTESTIKARELAEQLKLRFKQEVRFWDERMTSNIVNQAMLSAGLKRSERRAKADESAAALILQEYLDSQAKRSCPAQ